jgi:hypothetical protein
VKEKQKNYMWSFSGRRGFFLIINYEFPIIFPRQKFYNLNFFSTFGNYLYLIFQLQYKKDYLPSLKTTFSVFLGFHKNIVLRIDFFFFPWVSRVKVMVFFLRFLRLGLRLKLNKIDFTYI